MSETLFKSGDEIVVTKRHPLMTDGYVYDVKGWKGVVRKINKDGTIEIDIHGIATGSLSILPSFIELEAILNSPLYKALL